MEQLKTWQNLKISMLLTGSELIDGRLRDSNSFFVAKFLFDRGQRLERIMVCDDKHADIVDSLKVLATKSDIIITSGGLGPTTGDKTREAIASFLGVELHSDEDSLERIKKFFRDRNRPYTSNNDKQALIPESGAVLHNSFGTAACFSAPFNTERESKGILFALPGVPRELENLIPEQVLPAVAAYFSLGDIESISPCLHKLRIFGLGESTIGSRVVESKPGNQVEVSYRASFPEVQVLFRGIDKDVTQEQVETVAAKACGLIGHDCIFSNGNDLSLVEVVSSLLHETSTTIALAESCTGGMLGELLTCRAGSSEYFLGSIVTYSNKLKADLLGVSPMDLEKYGAVSAEVAVSMARQARIKASAKLAVSITGIAGPSGGSQEKPVGTCFLAIADSQGELSCKIFFPGSRQRVREYASYAALELVRRRLLNIPIVEPVFLESNLRVATGIISN